MEQILVAGVSEVPTELKICVTFFFCMGGIFLVCVLSTYRIKESEH